MASGETKPTVADIYRRLGQTICRLADDREKLQAEADEMAVALNRVANLHHDGNPKFVIEEAIAALERYRRFKK